MEDLQHALYFTFADQRNAKIRYEFFISQQFTAHKFSVSISQVRNPYCAPLQHSLAGVSLTYTCVRRLDITRVKPLSCRKFKPSTGWFCQKNGSSVHFKLFDDLVEYNVKRDLQ